MHIQKGQKVDINQDNHLSSVMIGLGWEHSNPAMDIDGAAFLLSAAGVCEQDDNLIFMGIRAVRMEQLPIHNQVKGIRSKFR